MALFRRKGIVFLALICLSVGVSSKASAKLIEDQSIAYKPPQIVKRTNSLFNKFRYISDQKQFGKEDYWQSYSEFLDSKAGDCEDFAIAKFRQLKKEGFDKNMYIAYVLYYDNKPKPTPHMVTVYKDGEEYIILDNLTNKIKSAKQRKDLVPIFMFNENEILIVRHAWSNVVASKYNLSMQERAEKYLLND